MQRAFLNTPIILTLSRLVFSPLFLPIGLVLFLPYENDIINGFFSVLYILLSLTDFFDGYLARKYNQVTVLGKALDPLADKFLLFSTLIALVTIQKIFFYWAIIFIGREFFIMGLRILALEQGFDIAVSNIGKSKTVAQTLYVTLAIYTTRATPPFLIYLEKVMLLIALILTLISAYYYYRYFIKNYCEKPAL
jgi:CDP-diacylglycerol--glycerol-3-phosphate 3-phosphatidyltransferase